MNVSDYVITFLIISINVKIKKVHLFAAFTPPKSKPHSRPLTPPVYQPPLRNKLHLAASLPKSTHLFFAKNHLLRLTFSSIQFLWQNPVVLHQNQNYKTIHRIKAMAAFFTSWHKMICTSLLLKVLLLLASFGYNTKVEACLHLQ